MDIKARKLELVQRILDTDEEALLKQIELLFASGENDWWDRIPQETQMIIEEGIGQLDRGEGIPNQEVRKQIREKFKFKS